MKNILNSDLTIFDEKVFFYFRNKYKPEIINYLNEKQYFEGENHIDFEIKKSNMIIWNALLIKEIVNTGYTSEHLSNTYDSIYDKINRCKVVDELNELELKMFTRYIDIIIEHHESTDHLLVNKILHFLHMNIENFFTIETITESLSISQSHASKVFKEHMNTTIIKYSKELKIKRAKALLKTTDDSVIKIGEKLGFYDQSHFSRTFKNIVGLSPKQFRLKD